MPNGRILPGVNGANRNGRMQMKLMSVHLQHIERQLAGRSRGPGARLRRGTCKEAIVGADLYGSSNQTHLEEQIRQS